MSDDLTDDLTLLEQGRPLSRGLARSNVKELLFLTEEQAKGLNGKYPFNNRRSGYGRSMYVFSGPTILNIFNDMGGRETLEQRKQNKRKRKLSAEKAKVTVSEDREKRTQMLHRALRHIGVEPRDDSTFQEAIVRDKRLWDTQLKECICTAAQMKYIHEHRWMEYDEALKEEVEGLKERKGYFEGIYRECAEEVQGRIEFCLPVDGLPWLPKNSTTEARTEEQLSKALAIAKGELYEPGAPMPCARHGPGSSA